MHMHVEAAPRTADRNTWASVWVDALVPKRTRCAAPKPHTLLPNGAPPPPPPRARPGNPARARRAEVLEAPGSVHLMVTHKSILRALLCVALGLPPTSFRAFDIHNGGICNFRRGPRGRPPAASCPRRRCCCC